MNKQLIVLLAVCLVSAHAFVKRDAPAASNNNYLETIQKKVEDFSKDINSQVTHAFDPDTIKKNFNEFVDSVNKVIHDIKSDKPAAPA